MYDHGAAGKSSIDYSTDELAAIGKKKLIPSLQEPVTYRVIDMNKCHGFRSKCRMSPLFTDTNVLGQEISYLKPKHDYRRHKPHPTKVAFLTCNVNTMLDPVCNVQTAATQPMQHCWWASDAGPDRVHRPPRTMDTTSREHYQYQGRWIRGKTRHGCNPHPIPALGTVPVTSLVSPSKPRLWKEGFSFDHAYDCRKDPSYPIRTRRQGHFVWGELHPSEVVRLEAARAAVVPTANSAGPPFRYLSTDSPPPPAETVPAPYREPAASLTQLCPQAEPAVSRSVSLQEICSPNTARQLLARETSRSDIQPTRSPERPDTTTTTAHPSAELPPVVAL